MGEDDAKLDITLYDPAETIYVKSNMAIVREHESEKSSVLKPVLYICEVIESQGEWETQKQYWREIKSIYEYKSKTEYAKGARCIYDNYLWVCDYAITKEMIRIHGLDQALVPFDGSVYWSKVKQTVGVAYHAVDHKEMYYDDGRNAMKWHKAAWFVPDEDWLDKEIEEEITDWNPSRQYEHIDTKESGDKVIKAFNYVSGTVKYLFECIVRHTTYGDTEWHPLEWRQIQNIEEWKPQRAYAKDECCIHGDVTVGEVKIVDFGKYGDMFTFKPGDKVIYKIDPKDADSEIQRVRHEYYNLPQDIITKLEDVGQNVNGVYILCDDVDEPDLHNFQREEWELTNEAFDLVIGASYNQGDKVIWSSTFTDEVYEQTFDGVLSIFEAKENLPELLPEQTPSADPSKWGSEEAQEQKSTPINHLYRAKKDITVGENLIWRRENFVIASQMIKPADQSLEWYGWVWKKLSSPTNGYNYAYMFPSTGPFNTSTNTYKGRFCQFIPETVGVGELEAQAEYTITVDSSNVHRLNANGFSDIRNYLLTSFGIPALENVDNVEYFSNFIYIYVEDQGWVRTDLPRYFNFRKFTALDSNSFFSIDENNDVYKVTVIPGTTSTETQAIFGEFTYDLTFYESGMISACKMAVIPFIKTGGYDKGVYYGVLTTRKYMNDGMVLQGEIFESVAKPVAMQNTNLEYFIALKDTIVGADMLAYFSSFISYDDIYYGQATPELLAACVYWGLTFSNDTILNYPSLSIAINYYCYENTSFKGNILYRFYMGYSTNAAYYVAKLISISGADAYVTIDLLKSTVGPYNFNIYGRFGTHFYGITHESYYSVNRSGVWDVDLIAGTFTLIKPVTSDAEFKEALSIAGIPYVNNRNFKFEGNVVRSLRLFFGYSSLISHIPSRNSYYYDSNTQELSVYIPMDDRELFSANTGLPVQATVYGGFFKDRIRVGTKLYGIYVYVPRFKGYNDSDAYHNVNEGAYFWMSYGYNDYVNGPFIGGAGTDEVSF